MRLADKVKVWREPGSKVAHVEPVIGGRWAGSLRVPNRIAAFVADALMCDDENADAEVTISLFKPGRDGEGSTCDTWEWSHPEKA